MPEVSKDVSLVRCDFCDAPVVVGNDRCSNCRTTLDGSEVKYVPYIESDDTVASAIKRFILVVVLVTLFSGFSLGLVSYVILGMVAAHYVVKIIKAF